MHFNEHISFFLALFACGCETHIPRKVPKSKDFYEFTRCRQHTTSTWLNRSGLMSVTRNLSRLILYVPKYLRLFVETYLLILYQKYLDTFCYPYRSLNLVRPRKKFNFFIRFYYYSDSNIKVKSCEEPPSPQPCPFFLEKQVNGYFSPRLIALFPCTRPYHITENPALNERNILTISLHFLPVPTCIYQSQT